MFEKIFDNIYRLCVPFENIYTSVFLVLTESGNLLIDSGDNQNDVNTIIVPALKKAGITPDVLAVTHSHGDHAGGLSTLADTFRSAMVCAFSGRIAESFGERGRLLSDGDLLLGCIRILHLPGHSSDSVGFLDTRSSILIGGDAVQLYGIARYGSGVGSPSAYKKTLCRLKQMNLCMYIASHDFFPLGAFAKGSEVIKYFDEALRDINCLSEFAVKNNTLTSAEIAAEFTKIHKEKHSGFPTIPSGTIKAILENK